MKRYKVREEFADRIFGKECDTAYVEECMQKGMPVEDVKRIVRKCGPEALDMFCEGNEEIAAITKLRDESGCTLSLCRKAIEFSKEHEGCTPLGYLHALTDPVITKGITFEERVRMFS